MQTGEIKRIDKDANVGIMEREGEIRVNAHEKMNEGPEIMAGKVGLAAQRAWALMARASRGHDSNLFGERAFSRRRRTTTVVVLGGPWG